MQPKNLHVSAMVGNNVTPGAYNHQEMETPTDIDRRGIYEATMNSPLLGQQMKVIYDLLFNNGAMTSGELDEIIGKRNSSARLTELLRVGAVANIGKKTCSATGRLAKIWTISTAPPKIKQSKRIYYPTSHELACFNRDLTVMMAQLNKSNVRLSIEYKNIIAWLRAGAPCKHQTNALVRQSRGSKKVKTDE